MNRYTASIRGAIGAIQLLASATFALTALPSYGEDAVPVDRVSVAINKSEIIHMPVPISRASVGNPEVADILVVGRRELYLLGKQLGSTNVTVWDGGDHLIKALDVEVTHDLDGLKRKLHELFPRERIEVTSVHGDIVLSGSVSSGPKLDAAVAIAASYIPKDSNGKPIGTVHNVAQVSGSQQVMIEIKVAEMARSLTRQLGFDFVSMAAGSPLSVGTFSGGATFPEAVLDVPLIDPASGTLQSFVQRRVPVFSEGSFLGPFVTEFKPAELDVPDRGLFLNFLRGSLLFNLVIDAAKNNDLAKILAEPTLTAVSGQEAKFIAGGEFPIPVAQDLGTVTIKFKEFGVAVRFLPVVLDSDLINLQINVEVSELSNVASATINIPTTTQTFAIPSLTKRAATTSVEIPSGETIGIAGLINSSVREAVKRFPGLGELPVIGPFFRSQNFLKEETELVIFVTPRLAHSTRDPELRLPTDAFVEPSDVEFYLMGKLEGKRPLDEAGKGISGGGAEGRFGHVE